MCILPVSYAMAFELEVLLYKTYIFSKTWSQLITLRLVYFKYIIYFYIYTTLKEESNVFFPPIVSIPKLYA